jgi:hypothetical protein
VDFFVPYFRCSALLDARPYWLVSVVHGLLFSGSPRLLRCYLFLVLHIYVYHQKCAVERAHDRNIRQAKMRIIHLPTFWTVIIDCILWFFIHIVSARLMVTIPLDRFFPGGWIYRTRNWELKGSFYSRYVAIRKWKHLLPDGSPLLGEKGFPKKHLGKKNTEYMQSRIDSLGHHALWPLLLPLEPIMGGIPYDCLCYH